MKISKEQVRDNKSKVNAFLFNRRSIKDWDEKLKGIAEIIKNANKINKAFYKGFANVKKDVWD